MNAAVLHEQGQTPRYEDVTDPEPGAQEMLLTVKAASLKTIDRAIAAGSHYHHLDMLPAVVGVDGVGVLPDGTRVYSGGCRPPYGMMAERAAVPAAFRVRVPDGVDDITAAALPNPGMSSWLALEWRAKLQAGENVLVLGATGVAGTLAVQIAKHLGAGRVVGAGRNEAALERLTDLGADAVISLEGARDEIVARFAAEAASRPFDIVLDYLWGPPAEALIAALTGSDLTAAPTVTRYVEIGSVAGAEIALPAAALRSSGLELSGSGGGSVPPREIFKAIPRLLDLAAAGGIQIETEAVPLARVAEAWARRDTGGRRIVLVP